MAGLLIFAAFLILFFLGLNYVSKQSQDNPDNFMSTDPESCAEVHKKFWEVITSDGQIVTDSNWCPICKGIR